MCILPNESFLSLSHRRRVAGRAEYFVQLKFELDHCLFSELPSVSLRVRHTRGAAAAHSLSLKNQVVERRNFQSVFLPPRFECEMGFATLCLTPESWICSWVQLTVGCFPELCFPVVPVFARLRKQFINNFVFPTWACAAGFYNNNNNSLLPLHRLVTVLIFILEKNYNSKDVAFDFRMGWIIGFCPFL